MGESDSALQVLRDRFGFDAFLDGQEPVIRRLLEGRSTLAIFPTGGGKSVCYQLPALMLDGVTLVISPLIALMKDQIDFLVGRGIAAARLDSSLEQSEARKVFTELRAGRLKLLYVAPERLGSERFLQTLRNLNVAMMAVDEAHCISEWGHNFRPDYLKLAAIAKQLRVPRVLALTATATPTVAKQIAAAFDIQSDDIVATGFHRPNLFLRITPCPASQRTRMLLQRLGDADRGPTIVYVTLQKTAEAVAAALSAAGFDAKPYHAGLDAEVRHQAQDWFMGSSDAIVVATIAFGMGIDKSDIRYIYHYNLPKSLENYAQEIGRAGRDGQPSVCEMLACADDRIALENFTYGDTPTPEAVAGMVEDVLARGLVFDVSVYELATQYDIRPLVIETALTYMELLGLIESTGPFYSEYRFQPLRSSKEILARFDPQRAEFIRKIFQRAKPAKVWFSLDVAEVERAINQPRQRIIAALNFLEEQGELTLQVAGVRQGYRLKQSRVDVQQLTATLVQRFAQREERDIARLRQVLELAAAPQCLTQTLCAYFGEKLEAGCGHCIRCDGIAPEPIPASPVPSLGDEQAQAIAQLRDEKQPSLASPRQVARFLCGINSPAVVRAKLNKHPQSGSLAEVPFREVLAFVGRIGRQ